MFQACFNCALCITPVFFVDHIKKKIRRRPSWGRGIIRKKKSYKKGTEEEEGEPESVEAAGPSDSCLTQDEESSCDISGPQTNGLVPSTEEESSNEPPVGAQAETPDTGEDQKDLPSKEEEHTLKESENKEELNKIYCLGNILQPKVDRENMDKQEDFQSLIEISASSDAEPQPKHTELLLVSQADCVNGNDSMDSMDSQTLKRTSLAVKITPQSESDGSNNNPEVDEHNAENMSEPTLDYLPLDGMAGAENVEAAQDKDGIKFTFKSFLQMS